MTDIQWILIVLASAFTLGQIAVAGLGIALMSRTDVKSVKVSPVYGLIAVVLFIAAILL